MSSFRLDASISLLLFGLTLGYLALWPHNLGHSDESIFLHHAKRVLAGSVPHRDFFDFYTPLANYLMAAAFGLFGTQIATAKLVMAVVHGAVVVLVYAYLEEHYDCAENSRPCTLFRRRE